MCAALLGYTSTAGAACPMQSGSVTVPATGSLQLCVPASTAAPITTVNITWKLGSVSRPVSFGPPGGASQFSADFTFAVTVPDDMRGGTGSAQLTSTGPGGTSGVASPAVTFPGFDRPAAPVLSAQ